jgi:hypothetical protein
LQSVTGLTITFVIRAISRGITTVISIIAVLTAIVAAVAVTASAMTAAIHGELLLTTATAAVTTVAAVLTLRSSPCSCSILFVSHSSQRNISIRLHDHIFSDNAAQLLQHCMRYAGVCTCKCLEHMPLAVKDVVKVLPYDVARLFDSI